ncbi:MAG TPA: hypothetical protein VNB64_12350 [Solirubrobacteraceae bacterium]|nr:hypothetical protein [Solirubrobacteraceae bacterium]
MKRTRLVAAVAVSLLVPATALGAWSSGRYAGRTVQAKAIAFTASQTRLSYLRLYARFRCTDGEVFTAPLRGFPSQRIGPDGRYHAIYTGATGASRYVHRGTVVNRRASGTFTGRRVYNERNRLDRNGEIVCVTGVVRYSIPRL